MPVEFYRAYAKGQEEILLKVNSNEKGVYRLGKRMWVWVMPQPTNADGYTVGKKIYDSSSQAGSYRGYYVSISKNSKTPIHLSRRVNARYVTNEGE